jgi:hypothetical protein
VTSRQEGMTSRQEGMTSRQEGITYDMMPHAASLPWSGGVCRWVRCCHTVVCVCVCLCGDGQELGKRWLCWLLFWRGRSGRLRKRPWLSIKNVSVAQLAGPVHVWNHSTLCSPVSCAAVSSPCSPSLFVFVVHEQCKRLLPTPRSLSKVQGARRSCVRDTSVFRHHSCCATADTLAVIIAGGSLWAPFVTPTLRAWCQKSS